MAALSLDMQLESAWHSPGQMVLGPLDLSIQSGETVALRGPSGAGKTTLLRIAAGLHKGFHGRCIAHGPLGMVFQEPALLPWRCLSENLELASRVTAEEAKTMLDRVGLGGMEYRFPHALSLGQMRRVSLARAFLARPHLLLLDEPFVSLDEETASGMMQLFEDLRRVSGAACLLVTHMQSEAERLADRSVELSGHPATLQDMPVHAQI